MNIDQIISVNKLIWTKYLKKVSHLQPAGATFLYPTIMLVSEVDHFFIVEFLGFSESFSDLIIKKHKKSKNLDSYLFQFNYEATIKPRISNELGKNSFNRFYIGASIDENILQERFFFQDRWPTKLVADYDKLNIHNIFNYVDGINYLEYNDCCIANRLGNIFRLKPVTHLHFVAQKIEKAKYKKHLIKQLSAPINHSDDIKGVLYTDSENTSTSLTYSQFLNVYSFDNLRETTIGEFLKNNDEIINGAFKSKSFLYEPELKWIEGNPDENEVSINPDFFIESQEGNWDILDLKLPYWLKSKLTKGPRKRRSFLQIVDEGLAQLANYEDYFNYEKNRKFALEKFGILIKKPRLILVIGNYNNYDKIEIDEASRKLKDNIMIIDYDTLNLKYYQSKVNFA